MGKSCQRNANSRMKIVLSIRLQLHFQCWLHLFSSGVLCVEAALIRNHHSAFLRAVVQLVVGV